MFHWRKKKNPQKTGYIWRCRSNQSAHLSRALFEVETGFKKLPWSWGLIIKCIVWCWNETNLLWKAFASSLQKQEKKVYREKSLIWSSSLSSEQRYFKESHLYLAACWQRAQRHRGKIQNGFQIKCGRNNFCASVGNRRESEFLDFKTATVVIQVTFPPSGSAWCPLPSTGHEISQMFHLVF